MKIRFLINKSSVTTVVMCMFVFSSQASQPQFEKLDLISTPRELNLLSSTLKANYDKIKSWQGIVYFHDIVVYKDQAASDHFKRNINSQSSTCPKELQALYAGTIEFKIDCENNSFFSHTVRPEPVDYLDVVQQKNYASILGPWQKTIILTSEYQIECYPDRWGKDNQVLGKIAKKKSVQSQRIDIRGVDPRMCFNAGIAVWDLLYQLAQASESQPDGVWVEKKQIPEQGLLYQISVVDPRSGQSMMTLLLDETMGYYPKYIVTKTKDGKLLSEISMEFVKIDDIFVPNKKIEKQYDKQDGGIVRSSDWSIEQMHINNMIPSETFTYKGCGLNDNDTVKDEIAQKTYRYKSDGQLIEVDE